MKAIDRIIALIKANGPMATPDIAAALGVNKKQVAQTILRSEPGPDRPVRCAYGKNPRGIPVTIWGIGMPAIRIVPRPSKRERRARVMRDSEEWRARLVGEADASIARYTPMLTALADNHFRTCIVQVAV